MPTSVLLAVLAAAGLLALAPALTRRYDATERVAAERATSTARVLTRRRRLRTVPGPRPINPPRFTGLSRGGTRESDNPYRSAVPRSTTARSTTARSTTARSTTARPGRPRSGAEPESPGYVDGRRSASSQPGSRGSGQGSRGSGKARGGPGHARPGGATRCVGRPTSIAARKVRRDISPPRAIPRTATPASRAGPSGTSGRGRRGDVPCPRRCTVAVGYYWP